MRIKKKKNRKKLIIISLSILIAIGLAIGGAAMAGFGPFAKKKEDNKSYNTSPPTKDQKSAGQAAADDVKASEEKPGDEDTPKPPSNLVISITSANQMDGMLRIRTMIDKLVQGTCTLSLKKGSQEITRSADTQALASTATCKGFDIPNSELQSGEWELSITLTANGETASTSQNISIN